MKGSNYYNPQFYPVQKTSQQYQQQEQQHFPVLNFPTAPTTVFDREPISIVHSQVNPSVENQELERLKRENEQMRLLIEEKDKKIKEMKIKKLDDAIKTIKTLYYESITGSNYLYSKIEDFSDFLHYKFEHCTPDETKRDEISFLILTKLKTKRYFENLDVNFEVTSIEKDSIHAELEYGEVKIKLDARKNDGNFYCIAGVFINGIHQENSKVNDYIKSLCNFLFLELEEYL